MIFLREIERHSPAPSYKIWYIIAGKECTAFCRWQIVYIAHGQNGTSRAGSYRTCHWFVACLTSGQIILGCLSYIIGVLQNKKENEKRNKISHVIKFENFQKKKEEKLFLYKNLKNFKQTKINNTHTHTYIRNELFLLLK